MLIYLKPTWLTSSVASHGMGCRHPPMQQPVSDDGRCFPRLSDPLLPEQRQWICDQLYHRRGLALVHSSAGRTTGSLKTVTSDEMNGLLLCRCFFSRAVVCNPRTWGVCLIFWLGFLSKSKLGGSNVATGWSLGDLGCFRWSSLGPAQATEGHRVQLFGDNIGYSDYSDLEFLIVGVWYLLCVRVRMIRLHSLRSLINPRFELPRLVFKDWTTPNPRIQKQEHDTHNCPILDLRPELAGHAGSLDFSRRLVDACMDLKRWRRGYCCHIPEGWRETKTPWEKVQSWQHVWCVSLCNSPRLDVILNVICNM